MKQKWLVLDDCSWKIVVPEIDVKPHSFPERLTTPLAAATCPCKPKISWREKIIVHNSFMDEMRMNSSLPQIV